MNYSPIIVLRSIYKNWTPNYFYSYLHTLNLDNKRESIDYDRNERS